MQITGPNLSGMSDAAARVYQSQAGGAAKLQRGGAPGRFDSVMLSTRNDAARSPYEMELRSRLSQEVRTATSSGQVAQLREQVQSGAYEVDAREIAKKMLLLGGLG